MHHETDLHCRQVGVTLVEMIVVIVVMGVLVAITSMFIRNQVTSYTDVAQRTDLADQADTAVRRLMRDLQAALPNSVRVSGNFMEFVPINDAGRYRADDFDAAPNAFSIFGPPVNAVAGDQLVIANMGIGGADFYAGDTRRSLSAVGAAGLSYTGAKFLFPSSQNRFQITSTPATYAFDAVNRTLWRYSGYPIQSAQVATLAGLDGLAGVTKAALATDVDVANSSFSYAASALQRNAIVSIRLTLSRNGESVTLFQQVNIFNTP